MVAGDGEDRAGASDRERRLLLTHASHDALLDALLPAQHAVYVKDRGGRYLMVNAAGAANLGYAPDQLVGKTDTEIFSGQLGERLWRSDQQIMSAGQARTVQEPVLVDGKLRTYLTTKAPLRDASGIVVGLVGASCDASSLSDLDEQLRRREAQLAEAQALTRVGSWSTTCAPASRAGQTRSTASSVAIRRSSRRRSKRSSSASIRRTVDG